MFYKMDTRNGEILVKNDFNKPKLADHYLSKLNQVYFVTKQVPQEVSRKPELAYLPIIQNAPIKTNLKTNFLSGALISSLNSMESFQMTRSASNSAKSRRANHKSHQTRTILSFGTVVNVPKKSTENLFVRNGFNVTLNTPYRLQSYRKVDRKSANSSPIIARETSAELKTKLQNTPVHVGIYFIKMSEIKFI